MFATNLKYLRDKFSIPQKKLAIKLSISRSAVSALENGKYEPNISTICKVSEIFEISIDNLIKIDLIQESFDLEDNSYTTLREPNLKILAISVDQSGKEKIEFIPERAKAGYLSGFKDPEYIRELPKFDWPKPLNGTYRAFEISGDSMLPLATGTIVVGKYIDNLNDIKSSRRYVLVTKTDGIVFKRVINEGLERQQLILYSDNSNYKPYILNIEDLIEAWTFYSYIGFPESIFDPLEHVMEKINEISFKISKVF